MTVHVVLLLSLLMLLILLLLLLLIIIIIISRISIFVSAVSNITSPTASPHPSPLIPPLLPPLEQAKELRLRAHRSYHLACFYASPGTAKWAEALALHEHAGALAAQVQTGVRYCSM
jgi:hypothetical protein